MGVKLGAAGVLLALCNNCKPIHKTKIRLIYRNRRLTFENGGNREQSKGKIEAPSCYYPDFCQRHSKGISVEQLLASLYGKKKPTQVEQVNLNTQLETLAKRGIILRKEAAGKYRYWLKTDRAAFVEILSLLDEEMLSLRDKEDKTNKLLFTDSGMSKLLFTEDGTSKLLFTDYFKETGRGHMQTLFNITHYGLLEIELNDAKQIDTYLTLLYGFYLKKSPLFMQLFTSAAMQERAFLQAFLNHYRTDQSLEIVEFPLLQLLGTYCIIIDYLKKNTTREISTSEMTDYLKFVSRLVMKNREMNEKLPDMPPQLPTE